MENNRTTKIALLIVLMLIITLTSVISTLAAQELLMKTENSVQEYTNTYNDLNKDNSLENKDEI